MKTKSSTLSKMGDKIIKAFEIADSFKKRKELLEQDYSVKIELLKGALLLEYKRCLDAKSANGFFSLKREVVQKHVDFVKKVQFKKTLSEDERQIIDALIQKYT